MMDLEEFENVKEKLVAEHRHLVERPFLTKELKQYKEKLSKLSETQRYEVEVLNACNVLNAKIHHIWRRTGSNQIVMKELCAQIRLTKNFREDEYETLIKRAVEKFILVVDNHINVLDKNYQMDKLLHHLKRHLKKVLEEERHKKWVADKTEVEETVNKWVKAIKCSENNEIAK